MGTVTAVPRTVGLTRADLDAMPDDGRRHELLDGTILVTPAPGTSHQTVVLELAVLLREVCPDELKRLTAPFDVVLADDTVIEPDLLVARRRDFTPRDLPTAPLLAVEVLSPSTRRIDLTLKKSRYEAAGCRSYWVVDPTQPSIIVWELEDDRYVERARAIGTDEVTVSQPFPVTFAPASLLD